MTRSSRPTWINNEMEITENHSYSDEVFIFGDYAATAKLGGGPLSTVWKAQHRITGEVVALKQINLAELTTHLRKCLDCELTFLSSVNHPNIISLLHSYQVEDCIFLVFEFCAGGNLADYIRQHCGVQERTAKRLMQQLGAALKVLNSFHVVHRDLKPENILLLSTESDEAVIKIADFGLSRIILSEDYAETVCGSPLYMAPELLQFQRYGNKVDMWSLGAILFELLNGYPPFHGRNNVQLLQNIRACRFLPFSQLILSQLHPDCIDLCSRLLSVNPDDRLSFDEFYHHNFLKIEKLAGESPLQKF